ncbi:fumarylacetoacetate hydrolase family protein [Oceanobacillus halotolerans]|uniref:fumarylacetoacetate hydrolase family protein n=1 Tax=Oceanobacillus halotolerans TaxID=2663380 RepID=UPI0013D93FE9|nr:fumarylacetoacetate hydrolase family protein [Oceanobacillus halotolerans]
MFVRFTKGDVTSYGVLNGDNIKKIQGDLFTGDYKITEETLQRKEVRLLAPCKPSKVICVGLNYKDHAKEVELPLPKAPLLFLKPPTSVVGPNNEVYYPEQSGQVDYEAELAIVIGKEAKNISEENANDYILGYTCANDVTARDIQFGDGQWTRGKSFDTFCPIGPGIVKEVDLENAKVELYVDGENKQRSTLDQLIFKVPHLVSYISQHMTLMPGDIILTGTPHGIGPVEKGSTMTVKVEGIGELANKLV